MEIFNKKKIWFIRNQLRESLKWILGREGIGLALLAILLVSCLNGLINPIADVLLPTVKFTIRGVSQTENRYTTILYEEYENNPDELFLELKSKNEAENLGWGYVKGEMGKSWTMLFDNPKSGGITIQVKESPRKYVTLLCGGGGGLVEIHANEELQIIDTYQEESGIIRVYPFEHSTKITFIRMILYVILYVLCFALFSLAYYIFVHKISVPAILLKPICKAEYFICAFFFTGMGFFQYRVIGIPNYLKNGDELGYWETRILDDNVSIIQRLSEQFPYYGYLCYVPQNILKYIGKRISVDAALLWIVFMGVLWSVFICGIFPGIYKNLSGKSASRLHIIPMVLIILTTQRLYLTSVMMDGLGMIAFFAYIYFATDILEENRWRTSGFGAGICAVISCNLRIANLMGVVAILVYVIGRAVLGEKDYKRIVEGVAIGLTAFLLVCIPQLVVNYNRDHIGLLPYDQGYSEEVDPERPWVGRKLTAWSSDYGMAHGNIAYPLLATDNQMLSMKTLHYGQNDPPLTMEQLFDIYSDSPVEALMLICKKLLIGFDQKTNINSPGDGNVPWRKTNGMLFSLWNYFVLFSGGFVLAKSKYVRRSEKWIAGIVIIFLVLPETFMKIEWRYVLPGYFLLYYFFTYAFFGPLFEIKEYRKDFFEKTNYLPALAVFMFAYLSMSFILLAQFN